MNWGEPAWLWLLVGWAALVLWVCSRSGQRTLVPFSALWTPDSALPHARRRMHPPPLAIALLLAAIGAGILAGAGPTLAVKLPWLFPTHQRAAVVVILDRGMNFAADGPQPFTTAATGASNLMRQSPGVAIDLWPVPGTRERIDPDQLQQKISAQLPTMLASDAALDSAVALAARNSDVRAIIVLSDRWIPRPIGLRSDISFCQLPISSVHQELWIVNAGARSEPRPQVMVHFARIGNPGQTIVRVASGREITTKKVMLHDKGSIAGKTIFLDVPKLGDTALCQLNTDSPLQSFYLARETMWPDVRIAPIGLPAGVEKFVGVYRRDRPPVAGSPAVVVASSLDGLSSTAGLVCMTLPPAGNSAGLTVGDHAITHGLDFSSLTIAPAGAGIVPAGFSAVVLIGGSPVIAVGQNPRRVWIALTANQWQAWSGDPGFVHFWTRAIGWCAQTTGRAGVYGGQQLPPIASDEQLPSVSGARQPDGTNWTAFDGPLAGIYAGPGQEPIALNAARPPWPQSAGNLQPLALRGAPVESNLQPILAAAGALLAACGIFIGVAPSPRRRA